jgi:hypothetical protein
VAVAAARGWSQAKLRAALSAALPTATAGEVERVVAAVAREPREG